MATANELYAMEPQRETNDIDVLFEKDHLNGMEFPYLRWEVQSKVIEANKRVTIKYLKEHCYDGRRVWELATVWLDGSPVMIIQNAGREGDDHSERYITDKEKFLEMCNYLLSLIHIEDPVQVDAINPDEELSDLTYFYGQSLFGKFDYHY